MWITRKCRPLMQQGYRAKRKKQCSNMHKVDRFFSQSSLKTKQKIINLISWWQEKRCSLVMKLNFIKEHIGHSFCIFVMGASDTQFELPPGILILLLAKAGTSWNSSSPTDLCYQEGSGEQEEELLLSVQLDCKNSKNMFYWIFMLNKSQLHFLISFCLPAVNTYSSSSVCPRNLSLVNSHK